MAAIYAKLNESSVILCSLSIMLCAGFLITRLTKLLKLPNVSGFIVAGILIGPQVLHLVPIRIMSHMGFMSDIALACIAFGVGKFFKLSVLKEAGGKVITVTCFESLLAGVFVTLAMHFIFHLSWNFSLVLGAIATATAPASTMMTISQYKAKGPYVNTLLQIVALDDVVCLLAYSLVAALVNASASGHVRATDLIFPVLLNIAGLAVGFLCGFILSKLLTPARSRDNRLIVAVAMLFGLSGLCAALGISPLLSCMVFGTTYINLTEDKKLYRQLDRFAPPVMSLFFIISGMNLDISALRTAGLIGAAYFIIRIAGKYLGTYWSCALTGLPDNFKRYMGLALIPQAGVAIGLAFLGQRILPPEMGNMLLTIILSSSVLYELIGPASAKLSFFLSGTIKKEDLAGAKGKNVPAVKSAPEGKKALPQKAAGGKKPLTPKAAAAAAKKGGTADSKRGAAVSKKRPASKTAETAAGQAEIVKKPAAAKKKAAGKETPAAKKAKKGAPAHNGK